MSAYMLNLFLFPSGSDENSLSIIMIICSFHAWYISLSLCSISVEGVREN